MNYYKLTLTGEFKPLTQQEYKQKQRESLYQYGETYAMRSVINGEESAVILDYANVHRIQAQKDDYKMPSI